MHVVFHATDEEGRSIELFGDAAEIRMERVARGFVAQERPAVFGGEDQMNVNGGKGLWHGARMPNRVRVFQSQRDSRTARRRGANRVSDSGADNPKGDAPARVGGSRGSIPKGLCPPAQGCEERATLGHRETHFPTATRLRQSRVRWRAGDVGHNPVGVVIFCGRFPRVARAPQPWAMGRNPVGIPRHRSFNSPSFSVVDIIARNVTTHYE